MSKHRSMIMEPHCTHRVCRSCVEQFKPGFRNQQNCEWCLDLSASNLQRLYRQACKAYKRIRIEAQCSGNACQWTTATCDQVFLRSLVPSLNK